MNKYVSPKAGKRARNLNSIGSKMSHNKCAKKGLKHINNDSLDIHYVLFGILFDHLLCLMVTCTPPGHMVALDLTY